MKRGIVALILLLAGCGTPAPSDTPPDNGPPPVENPRPIKGVWTGYDSAKDIGFSFRVLDRPDGSLYIDEIDVQGTWLCCCSQSNCYVYSVLGPTCTADVVGTHAECSEGFGEIKLDFMPPTEDVFAITLTRAKIHITWLECPRVPGCSSGSGNGYSGEIEF